MFAERMPHDSLDEARERLRREMEAMRLGATGEYPHGHYGKHDEGEIRFAVAADRRHRKVLIDFGKPVHSLGMTPEQAGELADMLTAKAMQAKGIDVPDPEPKA